MYDPVVVDELLARMAECVARIAALNAAIPAPTQALYPESLN